MITCMVNIDFDGASAAWRANKRRVRGGSFVYTCAYVHTNGKTCRHPTEATQAPRWRYTTHWKDQKQGNMPYKYCRKHKVRGPMKELQAEIL